MTGTIRPLKPKPDKDKPTFAFVINQSARFWDIAHSGCQKAAEEEDVYVDYQVPGRGSAAQQKQICTMLGNTLQAVISQTLFKRIDTSGMYPCTELMICNPGIRSCIRENRVVEIPNYIETGRGIGSEVRSWKFPLFLNGIEKILSRDGLVCNLWASFLSAIARP